MADTVTDPTPQRVRRMSLVRDSAGLQPGLLPGIVFRRTLIDNLMGIVAWGVGYSVLIVSVVILYPILEENNMLFSVLSGLGLLDILTANYPIDPSMLTTFPGYLAFEALGWGPVIFAAYLIPQTLGAVMAEEKRGTLDLLLSTPITRWQLITEKTLAIVVSLGLILSMMLATLLVSTRLSGEVELGAMQALAGIWHILPISLVVIAVTLLLSVTVYNPRTAGSLAALFIIVSYFVRSMSDMVQLPLLDLLRRFSVFHYYSSISTMIDGVNWRNDLGLMLLALVIFGLALFRFQRRDLGL